jgi:solute carrier family 35 protein E1
MKSILSLLAVAGTIATSAAAFGPASVTNVKTASGSAGVFNKFPVASADLRSPTTLALSSSGGAKEVEAADDSSSGSLVKTTSYILLWYAFNIGYNIYNKQALNVLAFPWTIATIQMGFGIAYFLPLWLTGIRKMPNLKKEDYKVLVPVSLCHTGVHVGAVVALGAGAVSFAHIVKASESVVTCAISALLLGQTFSLPVYLSLIPIIGGVGIASMKELSFTMLALTAAMLSNVSSSLRAVLTKKYMSDPSWKTEKNLDAKNQYAVLTAISTLLLIPMALAIEGTGFFSAFKDVVAAGDFTNKSLSTLLALGGAFYYAYNEYGFLALGQVNSVTHAVANTIKRVVIIVASVIAFRTPMSTGSMIGSSIAIAGTLLYGLASGKDKAKKN